MSGDGKRTVGLLGWFGSGNVGDDIQPLAIVAELGPGYDYLLYTDGSEFYENEDFPGRYVPIRYRSLRSLVLPRMREYDTLVFGGGGLLAEYGFQSRFAPILTRGLSYWLIRLLFAKLLGKKVFVMAVGSGQIRSLLGRALSRMVLGRVDAMVVRDEGSQRLLREAGVKADIVVTADPVFAYPYTPLPSGQRKDYVIFNVRTGCQYEYGPGGPELLDGNLDIIARAAQHVVESGLDVHLIPFEPGAPDDLAVAGDLRDRIIDLVPSGSSGSVSVVEFKGWQETLDLFGHARFSVCMRQHAVITSVVTGTPVIGLRYDQKISEIFRLMGGAEYCLDVEHLVEEELNGLVDRMLTEDLLDTFERFHHVMRERSVRSFDLLRELLDRQ